MSAVSPGTAALNAPIGVFDSGVGGLSVLRALRAEMPHEHFVYFADSGHAPYGERDAAKVIERSRAVLAALRADHGIKALVIACNTATAAAVQEKYGDWVRKEFGEKPISVFFPVISPDRSRIFFKIASGNGGDNFMSKGASHRQGLVVCDLAGNLIYQRAKWGHPAWHPDSRRIIEMGNILIDTDDGATARIADVPNLRGSHPAVSPDGRLMVTDGLADNIGGTPGQWGVMVGNLQGKTHAVLHTFSQGRGARSWRRSDPHPVFSADSKRIYYNVSEGEFTQLYVAEIR